MANDTQTGSNWNIQDYFHFYNNDGNSSNNNNNNTNNTITDVIKTTFNSTIASTISTTATPYTSKETRKYASKLAKQTSTVATNLATATINYLTKIKQSKFNTTNYDNNKKPFNINKSKTKYQQHHQQQVQQQQQQQHQQQQNILSNSLNINNNSSASSFYYTRVTELAHDVVAPLAHNTTTVDVTTAKTSTITAKEAATVAAASTAHSTDSVTAAAITTTTATTQSAIQTTTNDNLNQILDSRNDTSMRTYEAGSNFMLLLEDFGEYFYNYNTTNQNQFNSTVTIGSLIVTDDEFQSNCSLTNSTCHDLREVHYNYWALILILFPFLTLFGNVLVIISVCRERALQTVTNYFIVSLALADLLVAVVVMPFAVYVLVNGAWSLPNFVCDFYIAMDVICSTSSIFNLVAISIDRYIAVTQPIKYAKHKNSRRVCLTILLVWAISAAIGSPIVLGLNNTPDRVPDLCLFYNSDFIVYSSLSSFYIPCIIMVFLYWNIFKALRIRARKQRAARKPHLSDLATAGSVIENIAQTRRLAETTLDSSKSGSGGSKVIPDDDRPTNTASGSNEEDDDPAGSPDIDDCHVIVNDKSTEFMLATVVEEAGNVMAQIASPQLVADPNGNHDSGYVPSNIEDIVGASSSPLSPRSTSAVIMNRGSKRNGSTNTSPRREPLSTSALKPLAIVRYGVQGALALARNDSTLSTNSRSSRKDKKNSQASRFTIYKVHKASKKKREKSSAKKERKATKTLAIVLGVFLFCWVPFFTCNIMDAMCTKLNMDCQPGVTAFILTTWLGYMNSFVNPVIYTIFNPEFRKAFKKIMNIQ